MDLISIVHLTDINDRKYPLQGAKYMDHAITTNSNAHSNSNQEQYIWWCRIRLKCILLYCNMIDCHMLEHRQHMAKKNYILNQIVCDGNDSECIINVSKLKEQPMQLGNTTGNIENLRLFCLTMSCFDYDRQCVYCLFVSLSLYNLYSQIVHILAQLLHLLLFHLWRLYNTVCIQEFIDYNPQNISIILYYIYDSAITNQKQTKPCKQILVIRDIDVTWPFIALNSVHDCNVSHLFELINSLWYYISFIILITLLQYPHPFTNTNCYHSLFASVDTFCCFFKHFELVFWPNDTTYKSDQSDQTK